MEESEKVREEERREEKESEERRCRRQERYKVAIHCAFALICGRAGSKTRLAKAAGAEPSLGIYLDVLGECTIDTSQHFLTYHQLLDPRIPR